MKVQEKNVQLATKKTQEMSPLWRFSFFSFRAALLLWPVPLTKAPESGATLYISWTPMFLLSQSFTFSYMKLAVQWKLTNKRHSVSKWWQHINNVSTLRVKQPGHAPDLEANSSIGFVESPCPMWINVRGIHQRAVLENLHQGNKESTKPLKHINQHVFKVQWFHLGWIMLNPILLMQLPVVHVQSHSYLTIGCGKHYGQVTSMDELYVPTSKTSELVSLERHRVQCCSIFFWLASIKQEISSSNATGVGTFHFPQLAKLYISREGWRVAVFAPLQICCCVYSIWPMFFKCQLRFFRSLS